MHKCKDMHVPLQTLAQRYTTLTSAPAAICGLGVYDRKSICAEILSHNKMGMFTLQYKRNAKFNRLL